LLRVSVIESLEGVVFEHFFKECAILGFVNNTSGESMKFDWAIQERRGKFWGVYKGEELIAVSGCHWIPEINDRAFRIQYRACELPRRDTKRGLSKGHFNSMTFREVIPHQLSWINSLGDYDFYISTNHDNRNHRAMELMAKQGFLTKEREMILFHVPQTIWKLNEDYYKDVRATIGNYTI